MVGLAEVFMDLERVINSLISWVYQRPQCGWGYIETRRPCKGYPKRSFWQRIRSNPMRRNYLLRPTVDNVKYPHFRAK